MPPLAGPTPEAQREKRTRIPRRTWGRRRLAARSALDGREAVRSERDTQDPTEAPKTRRGARVATGGRSAALPLGRVRAKGLLASRPSPSRATPRTPSRAHRTPRGSLSRRRDPIRGVISDGAVERAGHVPHGSHQTCKTCHRTFSKRGQRGARRSGRLSRGRNFCHRLSRSLAAGLHIDVGAHRAAARVAPAGSFGSARRRRRSPPTVARA